MKPETADELTNHRANALADDSAEDLIDATDSAVLVDDGALEEKRQVEQDAQSEFATGELYVRGILRESPVPSVLGRLWRRQESGALLIRHESLKKIIYIRHGNPF